jgi:UDP-N-acetylmuramoyl-tripeptide--D-alanyl-D-alanine ligase
LGTMAELGADREFLHREVAEYGLARGVDYIFSISETGYGTPDLDGIDAAVAMCRTLAIGPDDALLVKGSRVAALERLVHKLLEGSR